MESIKDWIAPLISRIDREYGGHSATRAFSGQTGYCCQLRKFTTFRGPESPQEEIHATANDSQHHIDLVFDVEETTRWENELKYLAPKEPRDLTQYQRATFALQSFRIRMDSRKPGQLPRVYLYVEKWHVCGSSDETLYYPDVKEFGDPDDNDVGKNAAVVISRWWHGGAKSSPASPPKAALVSSSGREGDGQEREIVGYQRPGKWSIENGKALCAAYGPGILDAGVLGNGVDDGPPRRQEQPDVKCAPHDTPSAGPSGSGHPLTQEERVASLPTPPRELSAPSAVAAVLSPPTSVSIPLQPPKKRSVSPRKRITDVFAPASPSSIWPTSPVGGDTGQEGMSMHENGGRSDSGDKPVASGEKPSQEGPTCPVSTKRTVAPSSPAAPPSSSPLPSASAVSAILRAAAQATQAAPRLPSSSPAISQLSSPSHSTQPGSRIPKQNGLQQKWKAKGALAQPIRAARKQVSERHDFVDEEDDSEDDGYGMEMKMEIRERVIPPSSPTGHEDVPTPVPAKRQIDMDETPGPKRRRTVPDREYGVPASESKQPGDTGEQDNNPVDEDQAREKEEDGDGEEDGAESADEKEESEELEEDAKQDDDFAGSSSSAEQTPKAKVRSPIGKPIPKLNGFKLDMFLRRGGLAKDYVMNALEQAKKKRREQRRKSGPV
ncbi:hypothetical protein IAR50_004607 [Cryptococcus sp. DSM 104548]